MKNLIILISLCFLYSCSLPSYSLKNKYEPTTIDYSHGKWLLNSIDVNGLVLKKIEPQLLEEFSSSLGERFTYYPKTLDIMIPRNIGMNPTKKQLKEIKQLTGFDYFINVKGDVLKDELGMISGTKLDKNLRSNSSYMELEIYDLNNEIIIYSQKVTGTSSRQEDNHDVYFSKSAIEILNKSFDKLLKDIQSKTVKQ